MKKSDLAQTISILANAGVIAGIAFLAFELQQANRIAIASTEIQIRNDLSSINESIYTDGDVAQLLVKAGDRNVVFTPVERMKLGSFIRRLLNAWLALEIAYENGLVPPDTYSIIQDDPRDFLSDFPATLPEWRTVLNTYSGQSSREVMRVVNEVLEENGL